LRAAETVAPFNRQLQVGLSYDQIRVVRDALNRIDRNQLANVRSGSFSGIDALTMFHQLLSPALENRIQENARDFGHAIMILARIEETDEGLFFN
jgi:hypothetical protein